jgi:hypothetical protein
MLPMAFPIRLVNLGEVFGFDDEQVFDVLLLSSFCKVERPCDHGSFIDDHDLVMSDAVTTDDKI